MFSLSILDFASRTATAAILHGLRGRRYRALIMKLETKAQVDIATSMPCTMRVETGYCATRVLAGDVSVPGSCTVESPGSAWIRRCSLETGATMVPYTSCKPYCSFSIVFSLLGEL